MSAKPIAVLGGGAGGHMMAADLASQGYEVRFGEHPRYGERFRPVSDKKAVEAIGIGPLGTFPLKWAGADVARAIEGAEWIHLAMAANGHEPFFQEMVPHLKEGQKVVLWAGDFGSLRLKKLLADRGEADKVTVVESNTLPYGTRLVQPGKINLLLWAARVMVAALPAAETAAVAAGLKPMFPKIFAGKNVLEAAFNNPNPIVHPPGALLNTGRIQFSGGDFYMYHEGITEAVARVIRQVYEESDRVAEALGFEMIQYQDVDFRTKCSIMGVEFIAPFDACGVIGTIIGPKSLQDRYITEDLPFGLVPRAQLGRLVKKPTPVIDGLISVGGVVCEENYWETGRTLSQLGLAGLSRDEIVDLVNR